MKYMNPPYILKDSEGVVIDTFRYEFQAIKRAKELGVSELLLKPLTKTDLALTVRKVLGFGAIQ